jgi:hypothetical protein
VALSSYHLKELDGNLGKNDGSSSLEHLWFSSRAILIPYPREVVK